MCAVEERERREALTAFRDHICDDPHVCPVCLRLAKAIRWKIREHTPIDRQIHRLVSIHRLAAIQRLAGYTFKTVPQLKHEALLAALWVTRADENTPQRVRIGRSQWAALDANERVIFRTKEPDEIRPAEHLGIGSPEFVAWFRAAVIRHAKTDIESQLADWDMLPGDAHRSKRRAELPAGDDDEEPAEDFNPAFADPESLGLNTAAHFLESGRGRHVTTRRTLIRPKLPPGELAIDRKALSPQEKRIFELLKTEPSLSHAAIARRLGTTRRTVKNARSRIRAKGWVASLDVAA
jgi:hypothetical protein